MMSFMDLTEASRSFVRPLDVRRDLHGVADLIELCFARTLDADGRDYIRHIRRAANDTRYLHWLPGAGENVSIPLHGYVWEEDQRLVGNLSLIPFYYHSRWIYLIANVAVHPAYRRRGIARQLTQTALEHVHSHGAAAAWLQVRDDNEAAHQLYRSLGFVERARRTTWQSVFAPPYQPGTPPPPAEIGPRHKQDWRRHQQWLSAVYPPYVAWNLSFIPGRFAPSLWGWIMRLFYQESLTHVATRRGDELLGLLSWEPGRLYSDTLWLAPNPQHQDIALHALLDYARRRLETRRPLSTNYPAGQGIQAFHDCGFEALNTLIWMEVRYDPHLF